MWVLPQGSEDLKAFDQYMRDTTLKLNRKVEDLEDVRFIMGCLKEVGPTWPQFGLSQVAPAPGSP